MKKSFAYAAAVTLVMTLAAVIESFGTTFEQYDKMPFEQQSQFITERARTIYHWLEKNDPAKARCMIEQLEAEIEINGEKYSKFLFELEKKIRGVPQEKRAEYKFEDLLTGFITVELCGDVTSNPPQQKPADDRAK